MHQIGDEICAINIKIHKNSIRIALKRELRSGEAILTLWVILELSMVSEEETMIA